MTWATGTADAPRLQTYEAALKHEASVKPIKNRVPECKPLGRRDCTGLTIKKEGRAIVVSYWSTTVTYRPSGLIEVNLGGMPCMSQQKLLANLLGVSVFVADSVVYIGACATEEDLNLNRTPTYPMTRKATNHKARWLRYTYTSVLRPVKTERGWGPAYRFILQGTVRYPTKVTIDRAGAAAVRARHKEFLILLSGYIKLRGDVPITYQQRVIDTPTATTPKIKHTLKTDPMSVVEGIAQSNINCDYQWKTRTYRTNFSKAHRYALRLIYALHENEVYRRVPVTDGTIVRNKHK
jgi:hypothetical protein